MDCKRIDVPDHSEIFHKHVPENSFPYPFPKVLHEPTSETFCCTTLHFSFAAKSTVHFSAAECHFRARSSIILHWKTLFHDLNIQASQYLQFDSPWTWWMFSDNCYLRFDAVGLCTSKFAFLVKQAHIVLLNIGKKSNMGSISSICSKLSIFAWFYLVPYGSHFWLVRLECTSHSIEQPALN